MRIYADTASLADIERFNEDPRISGFTTNPTLFRRAEVTNPLQHAKRILTLTDKPVSLDGPCDIIWDLAPNAIPKVTAFLYLDHTQRINLTAVCTLDQTYAVRALPKGSIVSVFAGRIMDTGVSPQGIISGAKMLGVDVLWASVREPYNVKQASDAGCDIVTVPPTILDKMSEWWDLPLEEVARRTIRQFRDDAVEW